LSADHVQYFFKLFHIPDHTFLSLYHTNMSDKYRCDHVTAATHCWDRFQPISFFGRTFSQAILACLKWLNISAKQQVCSLQAMVSIVIPCLPQTVS
jgi:hypothetical protein